MKFNIQNIKFSYFLVIYCFSLHYSLCPYNMLYIIYNIYEIYICSIIINTVKVDKEKEVPKTMI